jgi:hypothetical protein
MKAIGIVTTAAISLLLGIAAPLYAQDQHEEQKDQQEQKDTAKPEEKKAQPEKKAEEAKPAAKPEEKTAQENKNSKPEEKTTQQAKAGDQAQHGRIPDAKFKANFGQEHTFRVSEGDYRNHRFQYGGYSFGFVGMWPANWLYTQPVYVVDIGGVYYLCNPVYPGVNIALSFTL